MANISMFNESIVKASFQCGGGRLFSISKLKKCTKEIYFLNTLKSFASKLIVIKSLSVQLALK